jgi:hypothetical protein
VKEKAQHTNRSRSTKKKKKATTTKQTWVSFRRKERQCAP